MECWISIPGASGRMEAVADVHPVNTHDQRDDDNSQNQGLIEVNISHSNSVSGVLVDPSLKFGPILNPEILVALRVISNGNRHIRTRPTQNVAKKDTKY